MKGTIGFDRKSERYYVAWYHEPLRRTVKLWFYHGDINIPFKKGKQGKELAQRMLDQMRGDYENGVFRIEKFSSKASDVVPYLKAWLEAVGPTMTSTSRTTKAASPFTSRPSSRRGASSFTKSSTTFSWSF